MQGENVNIMVVVLHRLQDRLLSSGYLPSCHVELLLRWHANGYLVGLPLLDRRSGFDIYRHGFYDYAGPCRWQWNWLAIHVTEFADSVLFNPKAT